MTDQSGTPDDVNGPHETDWRGVRRFAPDDDLLKGLDREGEPEGLRAFFATTIAASLLFWDLAFSLGAYHTVFYYRLFQILVASSVLLIGSLALRREVKVRPWMLVLLGIPFVWLVARFAAPLGHGSPPEHVLDLVLMGLTLASVPFTFLAVTRVVAPDFFALPNLRLKAVAVAIVVLVAIAGYLIGTFNYRFTTCQDYVLAGDNKPSNCSSSEPSPRPT